MTIRKIEVMTNDLDNNTFAHAKGGNRQDDGLLPCPFCGEVAMTGRAEAEKTMVLCANGHCKAKPWVIGHDRADATQRWNTRVPSREAAEGAGEIDPQSNNPSIAHKAMLAAAPPRPAPDAMRAHGEDRCLCLHPAACAMAGHCLEKISALSGVTSNMTNEQLAMALRNNLSLVGSRNNPRDLMAAAATRLIDSPPVRGDREIYAELARNYWRTSDSKPIRKDYECLIGGKIADAILSLPVQPAIHKTKFYAALSSHLQEDMIDIVWQAVQESGVFAGVQSGAGEREALAEACIRRLAQCNIGNPGQREMAADDILSTLQKIEAFASRQAPHSSSEEVGK